MASTGFFPCRALHLRATSIIIIAFFLTNPISRMIPIVPITLSSLCGQQQRQQCPQAR